MHILNRGAYNVPKEKIKLKGRVIMVFGRDLDKVIRCLGNELDVKYYSWNDETLAYDIRKNKLEEDVEMVRIVGNDKMIKLLRYGNGKVGLVLGHKVKKCKTQKEMIEVILHYAIDELGFMDKTLLSVFC